MAAVLSAPETAAPLCRLPDMRQLIRHRQGVIHAMTPNNGNRRFLKGAHFARNLKPHSGPAIYEYVNTSSTDVPTGRIYVAPASTLLRIHRIDKNGVERNLYQITTGDTITIGGQTATLVADPILQGDVYRITVDAWPALPDGEYEATAMHAGTWTPADLFILGEQGAWYDPSDLSTMFQDSAGTTPVTEVGQPVGLILDKSGNDNHASQATAADRPLLQNDGVNNYLAFDGVDDRLSVSAFNMSTAITMWIGQSVSSNGTNLETSVNPGSSNNALSFEWASGSYFCATNNPLIRYVYSLSVGAAFTLAMKFLIGQTDSAAIPVHSISGVQSGTFSGSGTPTGSFGTFPITLGGRYGGTECVGMNLYSIVFLCDDATVQEITDTEIWVAGKTGVTLP